MSEVMSPLMEFRVEWAVCGVGFVVEVFRYNNNRVITYIICCVIHLHNKEKIHHQRGKNYFNS